MQRARGANHDLLGTCWRLRERVAGGSDLPRRRPRAAPGTRGWSLQLPEPGRFGDLGRISRSYDKNAGQERALVRRLWRFFGALLATMAKLGFASTLEMEPAYRCLCGAHGAPRGCDLVPLFRFCFGTPSTAIGSVMPNYNGADSVPALLWLTHGAVEAYLNGSDEEQRGAQWL